MKKSGVMRRRALQVAATGELSRTIDPRLDLKKVIALLKKIRSQE